MPVGRNRDGDPLKSLRLTGPRERYRTRLGEVEEVYQQIPCRFVGEGWVWTCPEFMSYFDRVIEGRERHEVGVLWSLWSPFTSRGRPPVWDVSEVLG